MLSDSFKLRFTLHPHERRVQVRIDSTCAVELHERGYPSRQYIPLDDVRMDLLARPEAMSHCRFKNDTSYFSCGEHQDMACVVLSTAVRGNEGDRRKAVVNEEAMV